MVEEEEEHNLSELTGLALCADVWQSNARKMGIQHGIARRRRKCLGTSNLVDEMFRSTAGISERGETIVTRMHPLRVRTRAVLLALSELWQRVRDHDSAKALLSLTQLLPSSFY